MNQNERKKKQYFDSIIFLSLEMRFSEQQTKRRKREINAARG
jgi:hypothetical protein